MSTKQETKQTSTQAPAQVPILTEMDELALLHAFENQRGCELTPAQAGVVLAWAARTGLRYAEVESTLDALVRIRPGRNGQLEFEAFEPKDALHSVAARPITSRTGARED